MNSPLVFSFDTEPGLTHSELERLWNQTQQAQNALDKFLAGEFTEHEMTDFLSMFEIDINQTRELLDQNAQAMGMIAYQ